MKPLFKYITNDITICNNADLEMKSVYLCVFSLIVYFFMNIHEYANEIFFSCRTTGCKDLTYHIRNDMTTCNNEDYEM